MILRADLVKRILEATEPDLERSLVIGLLRAVTAVEGAPAARRKNRVVRQSFLSLEVARHLPVAFEVEISVRCLRDLARHDAVAVHDSWLTFDGGDREVTPADKLERQAGGFELQP